MKQKGKERKENMTSPRYGRESLLYIKEKALPLGNTSWKIHNGLTPEA